MNLKFYVDMLSVSYFFFNICIFYISYIIYICIQEKYMFILLHSYCVVTDSRRRLIRIKFAAGFATRGIGERVVTVYIADGEIATGNSFDGEFAKRQFATGEIATG